MAHAIVVTVAVAQVAGSAMIEATVAIAMTAMTATTAVIAVIEKIATVKATPPDGTVVPRVVMAVAKAQRQVLVIVSSVTPERRKLLLSKVMQQRTPGVTAQRMRQQPHDHRANQEKLASRANRVLIEVSEASADHVASVLIVQIADHVMPMQSCQRQKPSCLRT